MQAAGENKKEKRKATTREDTATSLEKKITKEKVRSRSVYEPLAYTSEREMQRTLRNGCSHRRRSLYTGATATCPSIQPFTTRPTCHPDVVSHFSCCRRSWLYFFFPPLSPPSNWSATHSRTHTSVLGVPSEAPPVIRPHSEHLIERSLPSSFFLFREVGLHKRQDTLNVRKRSYRPEGRIGG